MQGETRQVLIGWIREFGLAMAIYIAALVAAIWALHAVEPGVLRMIIVLAPILPGLALIALTVRAYAKCDEYIQQRTLQAAAVAAVVVAIVAQMVRLIASGK